MERDPSPRLWRIDKTWRFHRSVVLTSALRDENGVWAAIWPGARVVSHDTTMTSFPTEAIVFFPTDRWWTAIFMPGASPNLHVDIATPGRIDGDEIRTVDLDLDVVRTNDGIALVDEDEFDANQAAHGYSDDVVAAARHGVAETMGMIEAGQFPFDQSDKRIRELLDTSSFDTR